jgi:hypothetical protein
MNPTQIAIRSRLEKLPAELAPLRDAGLRYLQYCSAIEIGGGALLVAHQPWVGPEAYLITLYPGVMKAWLPKYERATGVRIPALIKRCLTLVNGCEFFGLSIYGIPPSMAKKPGILDRSKRQCRDIGAANKHWKGEYGVDPAYFHYGGRDYTDDELVGYFLDGGDLIHAVTQSGREVGKWSKLADFLQEELAASERIVRTETPDEWWH